MQPVSNTRQFFLKHTTMALTLLGLLLIVSSDKVAANDTPRRITSAPASGFAHESALTIALYDAYLPLSDYDKQSGWHGFAIELTQHLVGDLRPVTALRGLPWKRALKGMQAGSLSLLYEVSYRQERLDDMDFIGTADVERAFLVTQADTPLESIDSLDDFMRVEHKTHINTTIAWNQALEHRLSQDVQFRQHFILQKGSILQEAAGEHINTRSLRMRSRGGIILTHVNHQRVVDDSNRKIDQGESGARLKSIPIRAFGDSVTYLAASRQLPLELRQTLRARYQRARADGSFDNIWQRWHAGREPPPNLAPPSTTPQAVSQAH